MATAHRGTFSRLVAVLRGARGVLVVQGDATELVVDALPAAVPSIPLMGESTVEVVGESYHMDALMRVMAEPRPDTATVTLPAALLPEPGNPGDPHAIGVWIDGHLVGYLPRNVALSYQGVAERLLERECVGAARAYIVANFDVKLDLAPPEWCLPADPDPVG